jgi:hypothetical protein
LRNFETHVVVDRFAAALEKRLEKGQYVQNFAFCRFQ